jgi:3-oxoacyl-[acyl-carrier protein] reductase
MDLHLEGQKILVTGSSAGIGRGIAEEFLQEGAQVILTGRNPVNLNEALLTLGKVFGPERVHAFGGDLSKETVVAELALMIEKEWGRLDHLICNIGSGRALPTLEEDASEWQRMMDINLFGAATCVRVLLPQLKRSAIQGRVATSITFVASICGVEALGCPVTYAAAKHALIAYAKNIARPLGPQGIRVNLVSPGNILFPGSIWEKKLAENEKAVTAMLRQEVPLQRLGTVPEVAALVAFLASSHAAFITGANMVVDGGQTRSL